LQSECLYVCLFAAICLRPHDQISQYFLNVFLVTVAQFFSDDSGTRYALPVVWMTSGFYIMEGIGQNQHESECFVKFARWQHRSVECTVW